MTNVVKNLRATGISYDIIAEVCGETESYTSIRNYADETGDLPESVLDKLKRLQDVVNNAQEVNEQAGVVFEKHVVTTESDKSGKVWAHLYELWMNGIISDEDLTLALSGVRKEYDITDLVKDFSDHEETPVEDLEDIVKAEPRDYMAFHKNADQWIPVAA